MEGRQGYDCCWPAVVAPRIVNFVVTVSLESISEHQEIRGISLILDYPEIVTKYVGSPCVTVTPKHRNMYLTVMVFLAEVLIVVHSTA
jgi:hypothetical protein